MTGPSPNPCPDELLAATVAELGPDQAAALSKIEALLRAFPADQRLLFLKGSLLAGLQRYAEARRAMEAAVSAAPDYALARFQLGFLELTSGDATAALETWRPLDALASDNPLRLFAGGLAHLVNDEFPQAIDALRRGIGLNRDIPPLNGDMQMLIDKMQDLMAPPADKSDVVSAAHLLLQRYGHRSPTKH